jgi:hypothetical protein
VTGQRSVGARTSGRGRTGKDFFRQQRVHTDVAVDELRDVDVHRDAREHVGFIAVQMLFLHEKFDHVAHRMLGGFLEILAEAYGNAVLGRLAAELPSDAWRRDRTEDIRYAHPERKQCPVGARGSVEFDGDR